MSEVLETTTSGVFNRAVIELALRLEGDTKSDWLKRANSAGDEAAGEVGLGTVAVIAALPEAVEVARLDGVLASHETAASELRAERAKIKATIDAAALAGDLDDKASRRVAEVDRQIAARDEAAVSVKLARVPALSRFREARRVLALRLQQETGVARQKQRAAELAELAKTIVPALAALHAADECHDRRMAVLRRLASSVAEPEAVAEPAPAPPRVAAPDFSELKYLTPAGPW